EGFAAHGVAESEETGADQREREEDAENGRHSQRDLAVGGLVVDQRGAALVVAGGQIGVIVDEAIQGYSLGSVAEGATGARLDVAMVLLNRLISSMGSGK